MIYFGDIQLEEDTVIYFKADRFYPNKEYIQYAKNYITAKEIVSFDCALFNLTALPQDGAFDLQEEQILAIVINPKKNKEYVDNQFQFCGFDLYDENDIISFITNYGFEYEKAIHYKQLNQFGLIDDYETVVISKDLLEKIYKVKGQIVKIWRRLK